MTVKRLLLEEKSDKETRENLEKVTSAIWNALEKQTKAATAGFIRQEARSRGGLQGAGLKGFHLYFWSNYGKSCEY